MLSLDAAIAELDLEEALENSGKAEQLYKAGFISEEDYRLELLDTRLAELHALRTSQQYISIVLEILKYYGLLDLFTGASERRG